MRHLRLDRPIKNGNRLVLVIPHTHWDRAWYHPFEQFRMSLVKVFRRLMEVLETDSRFRCFTFDGQTVVLEDYLEIYPEDRGRIEKLVRKGRLTFGPFYVLPDVFLPTGEALIRNAAIGQEIAESFGRSSRQGWVADPFGLISQLPQIFAGAGIESIFFSRGVTKEQLQEHGPCFWWQGPDKTSRIIGIAQVGGYSNLMNWGVPLGEYPRNDPDTSEIDFPAALGQLRDLLKQYETYPSPSGLSFLGNGCDHHSAQHKLPDIIEYCSAKMPDLDLAITDSDGFVEVLKRQSSRLGTIQGELFGSGIYPTLEGTFDSRFYLKQQMDHNCMLLEKWVEPMVGLVCALGCQRRVVRLEHHIGHAPNIGNGSVYMHDLRPHLKYAWKTLLRNTPHDDICGSSTDPTHQDAENRAKRVDDIGSMLASDAALRLAAEVRAPGFDALAQIFLFNSLARGRTANVVRTFTIPSQSDQLRVVDEKGRALPVNISAKVTGPHFRRWNSERFEDLPQKQVQVELDAQVALPASGYRCLYIQEGQATAPVKAVKATNTSLENAHVRLSVNADGSFDLTDKRNGGRYRRLNSMVDYGDAGDLYRSRLLGDRVCRPIKAVSKLLQALPDKASLQVKVLMRLPCALNEKRTARCSKLLPLEVSFTYTLLADSPLVHIKAQFVNAQADHRLMVEFPTGFDTDETHAGSTFDVVPHAAPFMQASCRDFATAAAGGKRLTILSRSMHSYDARRVDGKLVMAKCLLKASSFVFLEVLPFWPSPEGNCIGRAATQEYAVLPGRQQDKWDGLQQASEEFVSPPYVDWMQVSRGIYPPQVSFVRVPSPLHVSAFKQADKGESLILRLYNMSDRSVRRTLWLSPLLKVKRVYECDMRERRRSALAMTGQKVNLAVRQWQILTLELERRQASRDGK